jgi:hypothetical protein
MTGAYKLVQQSLALIFNEGQKALETFTDSWGDFFDSIPAKAKKAGKKSSKVIIDIGEAETENWLDIYSRRYARWFQQRHEFQQLVIEKMGEEFTQQMELTGEYDELFFNHTAEQREKILEELAEFQLTKKEIEAEDLKERLKAKIKERNDELKFEQQHKIKLIGAQKAYYKTMKFLDSSRLKEAGKFASDFNAMATSSNKELRAIAKVAANVQIVSNTAAAASSAMAGAVKFFGIPAGPIIGGVLAAAQIAFGVEQLHRLNAQKLADGGIVSGGISGIDSVPAMLMPGELVVPKRNAEDALNALGATRDADVFGDENQANIIIGFDSEEAGQFLTAQQIENQALGISIEEAS